MAVRRGPYRGYYVVGNTEHPTVADLTAAAADSVGAPGAVPGSEDEARARLGDYFVDVLLLDQAIAATPAQKELGWSLRHPGLAEELRHGSHRN